MEPNFSVGNWPKGVLPDDVQEFAHWLCTPKWEREQKSISQWAEAHGYNKTTCYRWRKDERFQRFLRKVAEDYNLGTERIQDVINSVFEKASNGDMQAARLYLEHVNKLRPPTVVVEHKGISEMSQEELDAELKELLGGES